MEGQPQSYIPKAVVRRPAPTFSAIAWDTNRFRKVTLEEFKGKYVVLFFYPLDFTFVCPTEIVQFNDMAPEFAEHECQLLACSIDSQFVHREWTLKPRDNGGLGKMQIPLIADLEKKIGKDYGVYVDDSSEDAGVHLRATFIIDREGILRHASINDLPVGRNTKEILRLVQAFQYTDVYGEVCPENWTPGAFSIIPDPEAEKNEEYWKNHHAK